MFKQKNQKNCPYFKPILARPEQNIYMFVYTNTYVSTKFKFRHHQSFIILDYILECRFRHRDADKI